MMTQPPIRRLPPGDFTANDSRFLDDLALLEKGASRLRRLGRWGMFLLGILAFPIVVMVAVGGGPALAAVAVFVASLTIGLIIGPYFVLGRLICRGHRWAVLGGILLIGLMALVTCLMILHTAATQPGRWPIVLLETTYLIGHLNLIKLLFQCFGAATRFAQRALPPLTALAADDFQTDFRW